MSNITFSNGSRVFTPQKPPEPALGDVNGDGEIDILDAADVTSVNLQDYNLDGVIDILDAAALLSGDVGGIVTNDPTITTTPDTDPVCPEKYGFEIVKTIGYNTAINDYWTRMDCKCKGPNYPIPTTLAPGITKQICTPCMETEVQSELCGCRDLGYGVLVTLHNYEEHMANPLIPPQVTCETILPRYGCVLCVANEEDMACPFTDCAGQLNKWYNREPLIGGGCFSSEDECYYETILKYYEQYEFHLTPEEFGRNGTYRSASQGLNPNYAQFCACAYHHNHTLAYLRAIEREKNNL